LYINLKFSVIEYLTELAAIFNENILIVNTSIMRKKYLMIIIVINLGFIFNTVNSQELEIIYEEKGFNKLAKDLKPIILETPSFYRLREVDQKNCVAVINEKGEFSLLKISDKGEVSIKTLSEDFPSFIGEELFSDFKHNILWQVRGRGLYIFDIKTKKTAHTIPISNFNYSIITTFLADPDKKIFYTGLVNYAIDDPSSFRYTLTDINKDNLLHKSPLISGLHYQLTDDLFLFNDYLNNSLKWYVTNLDLEKKQGNKLTKT